MPELELSEHQIQRAVVAAARFARDTDRLPLASGPVRLEPKQALSVGMLAAIPNGGGRGAAEAGRLKAEGVLAGYPDLVMPLPDGGVLWIEMKSPKGRVRQTQETIHAKLHALGHEVVICRSEDDALTAIAHALGLDTDDR